MRLPGRSRPFPDPPLCPGSSLCASRRASYEFGVAGDAQILALLDQKLLIDQVAQHVFILFSDNLVGVSRILLLRFLAQLLLAALELRARDDLVVDAGDDLLDDRIRQGR